MHYTDTELRYEIERGFERAFLVWSCIAMVMAALVAYGAYDALTRDDEPEELRDVTSLVRGDEWAILNQNPLTHHVQEDWE